MKVMSDTEKVLNLIMGWKFQKELEKPKRDKRLEIETKFIELYSSF